MGHQDREVKREEQVSTACRGVESCSTGDRSWPAPAGSVASGKFLDLGESITDVPTWDILTVWLQMANIGSLSTLEPQLSSVPCLTLNV